MSEEMIRKLRRKFTINAMLSLVLVMVVIAGLIFLINLVMTRRSIQETMNYIVENNGEIQDAVIIYQGDGSEFQSDSSRQGAAQRPSPGAVTTEGYDMREFIGEVFGAKTEEEESESDLEEGLYTAYFEVSYRLDGSVEDIKANHMPDLTSEEAIELADYALGRILKLGQYGKYYYNVTTRADGSQMVIYLDSTNQVTSTSRLLYIALLMILAGGLITFIFVRLFSYRAIEPEIRNYELQKQFITNASHELKTPLAVIKANTEMQEMLAGETEWTQSTLRQVDRMNALIKNLVMITKAQETENIVRVSTDVSRVISDTADTYRPVAEQEGKTLEKDIPEGIAMNAVDSEIRQLVTLLLDNAVKYCDEQGTIRVSLWQKGRDTGISVTNSYAEGENVDYSRFFERFYRADEAHTIDEHSGFGIGLSIAESLVEKYHGSIRAEWKSGMLSFVCTLK